MLFSTPLLSRQQAQPPHSIKSYAAAAPGVQELYLESTKTSSLLIIDADGFLRMAAAPQLTKDGDRIINIQINMSDTEFLPGKLPPTAMKHFVSMAPRTSVPDFAIYHKKLTTALLDGAMAGTNITLFALPIAVPIGYGKQWVEGFDSDQGVQDQVEQVYGPTYKAWMRAVVSALDHQEEIAGVYGRVKDANALAAHLGSDINEAQIHTGPPTVGISVVTRWNLKSVINSLVHISQPLEPQSPRQQAEISPSLPSIS